MKINIAWIYPDLLNLHGERGNAKAFELISKKLNIDVEISRIEKLDEQIDFDKYDILLFNAGELKVLKTIKKSLEKRKEKLKNYIDNNKIIFITGTTGALFGKNVKRKDDSAFSGLGLLDMDLVERNMVIGDDLYYKLDNMEIMGCQIQMVDIILHGARQLGSIIYGYGNNGSTDEGARLKNVIFTNALGPILVKNPWLTEYLLKLACKNKGMLISDNKADYSIELASLASTKEFIQKKLNN